MSTILVPKEYVFKGSVQAWPTHEHPDLSAQVGHRVRGMSVLVPAEAFDYRGPKTLPNGQDGEKTALREHLKRVFRLLATEHIARALEELAASNVTGLEARVKR